MCVEKKGYHRVQIEEEKLARVEGYISINFIIFLG